jgi:hypothetical protein
MKTNTFSRNSNSQEVHLTKEGANGFLRTLIVIALVAISAYIFG